MMDYEEIIAEQGILECQRCTLCLNHKQMFKRIMAFPEGIRDEIIGIEEDFKMINYRLNRIRLLLEAVDDIIKGKELEK